MRTIVPLLSAGREGLKDELRRSKALRMGEGTHRGVAPHTCKAAVRLPEPAVQWREFPGSWQGARGSQGPGLVRRRQRIATSLAASGKSGYVYSVFPVFAAACAPPIAGCAFAGTQLSWRIACVKRCPLSAEIRCERPSPCTNDCAESISIPGPSCPYRSDGDWKDGLQP